MPNNCMGEKKGLKAILSSSQNRTFPFQNALALPTTNGALFFTNVKRAKSEIMYVLGIRISYPSGLGCVNTQ